MVEISQKFRLLMSFGRLYIVDHELGSVFCQNLDFSTHFAAAVTDFIIFMYNDFMLSDLSENQSMQIINKPFVYINIYCRLHVFQCF